MAKTIDLQKAIETVAVFRTELAFMEKASAPKQMVADKKAAIAELEIVLAENESQVKCTELISGLEQVKADVVRIVKSTKSDFPLNIRFRFESGELSKFTVTAAVASSGGGSGSRSTGTLTYNGKEFPRNVSCNYSAKKDFVRTGTLEKGVVFKSYKDAAMAALGTVPEAKKLYDSKADNAKYHSASAHDVLNRMFKWDIDNFFDSEGVVNGPKADEK